jgi:diguanylate cyclase (GGDEF)-like protein
MSAPLEPKVNLNPPGQSELLSLLAEVKQYEKTQPLKAVEVARTVLNYVQVLGENQMPAELVLEGLWSLSLSLANIYAMPEALEYALEALEWAEFLADFNKQVRLLNIIGNAYSTLGLAEDALENWQHALELCVVHPDPELSDLILSNLATIYTDKGNFEQALALYNECLPGVRARGNLEDEANLLNSIASTYVHYSEHDPSRRKHYLEQAKGTLEASLALYRQIEEPADEVYAWSTLVEWSIAAGELDIALEVLPRVIEQCRRVGQVGLEGSLWVHWGEVCQAQGDFDTALLHLNRGLASTQATAMRSQEFEAQLKLSQLHERMGNYLQALEHHKCYYALSESLRSEQVLRKMQVFQMRHEQVKSRQEADFQRRRVMELEELSQRDQLTGLYNRRYLEVEAAAQVSQALANKSPLSIVLVDVDHFKRINDTFSHHVGDKVLRTLAHLLEKERLEREFCVRYGGEEFVVVLPGLDLDQTLERCEDLRRQIETFDWDQIAPGLRLTVSIGFCNDLILNNHEEMLHCADFFLYEAKRAGRNRVYPRAGNTQFV